MTADEGAISFFLVLHEKSGSSMPYISYLKNGRDKRLLRLLSVEMWDETKSKVGREQRVLANGHPGLVQKKFDLELELLATELNLNLSRAIGGGHVTRLQARSCRRKRLN